MSTNYCDMTKQFISAAYTSTTWNKHNCALKCFSKFDLQSPNVHTWPLKDTSVNEFCIWALVSHNLKHSTVSAYLSSLATIHRLKGIDDTNCNNYISKTILRGAENLDLYTTVKKNHRAAMSLPILKILGHEIANSTWPVSVKQVIWTTCCIAFFGSLRLGEILSPAVRNFDPFTTLLWKNVTTNKDTVLIHIRSPKSRNPAGDFVDIFEFRNHNCCPVKAMLALQKVSIFSKDPESPVFRFDNGSLLTKAKFNDVIQLLLKPHIDKNCTNFTGHSFRAGIPTALAKLPSLAKSSEIMGWGRWSSQAYKLYTRLHHDRKKAIFAKISTALNTPLV